VFSYEVPKSAEVGRNSLVITQEGRPTAERPSATVRIEIAQDGLLLVDLNVTGLRSRDPVHSMADYHQIVEGDVATKAETACQVALAILGLIDPHHRIDRLLLNCALGGIGYRQWTKERREGGTFGMRMGGADPVPAFESPIVVTRSELNEPGDLVSRAVAMLRRGVEQG
jgi:hypothetical protein